MRFDKEIAIEIAQRATGVVIYAKQSDTKSRYYKVTFTDNGKKVDISGATAAAFRGEKPDGHSFAITPTINSDGTITIEVGGQVLTAAGYVECDVTAFQGNSVLSTGNFLIKVDRVPLGDNATDSTDEYSFLNQAIAAADNANAAAASVEAAKAAATTAAANANAAAASVEAAKTAANTAASAANTAAGNANTAASAANTAAENANTAAAGAREATALIDRLTGNYLYINAEGHLCRNEGSYA